MRTLILSILLVASAACAQRRSSAELQHALEGLAATDADTLRGAIEGLGILGDPRAVRPLVERVERGLPPELLEAALDALAVLGGVEAGPLFFELTTHRRAAVRLKAVQAIVATHPPGADRALAGALSDSDPAVRSAATDGLAELGAVSALDRLFLAFDRDVPGSLTAIARLARAQEVDRLLGYLGRRPFSELRPALVEIITRADLAERVRLGVVHRIGELATPEARALLEEVGAALPAGNLQRAALESARRISS